MTCDWLSDHNTDLWLAREVFLNNDSFPSMNVRLSLEELGHSEGGLYRIAAYRAEEYSANIRSFGLDQNSKKWQLMSSSLVCRCAAPPSLELDSLFCERVEEFWHLEYLDNYLCCTRAGLPVLTSAQCRDPGHSDPSTWTWSPWSSWGACQRVVTSIEVASVRRR